MMTHLISVPRVAPDYVRYLADDLPSEVLDAGAVEEDLGADGEAGLHGGLLPVVRGQRPGEVLRALAVSDAEMTENQREPAPVRGQLSYSAN